MIFGQVDPCRAQELKGANFFSKAWVLVVLGDDLECEGNCLEKWSQRSLYISREFQICILGAVYQRYSYGESHPRLLHHSDDEQTSKTQSDEVEGFTGLSRLSRQMHTVDEDPAWNQYRF